MYSIIEKGTRGTTNYAVYFANNSGPVSPFHDIPLIANPAEETYNMVVEIPRWSNAKMEIGTKERLNPIKQDVKKGKLRYVDNCFPYHGYIWNYGAFPQTWEDPNQVNEDTSCKGDNDPLDVCEIGSKVHKRGEVIQVKVLGTFALIDEGETDWKIIAIDVTDPLATVMSDIEDVEKHMPGLLAATHQWFRIYKMPTGKPPNEFAFDGKPKNQSFAVNVINETHKQWEKLVGKLVEPNGLCCLNRAVAGSPYYISKEDAQAVLEKAPPLAGDVPALPEEVQHWHFVSADKKPKSSSPRKAKSGKSNNAKDKVTRKPNASKAGKKPKKRK